VPISVWRALFVAYAAVTAVHIGWVMLHEPFYFDAWNVAITSGAKPITASRFFDFWWHEYTHSNPRLGQPLTYLSYKLEYFAVVAMPLAFLAIGAAVTTLGIARLPSLRRARDLALWTFATGALWFALPQIGKTLFCVAYGANYVYTAAIQLWFLVPLRLVPSGTASPAKCAAYAAAGVAAGLCNEHTGPTLCAFLVLYAWWIQHRTGTRPRLVWAGAAGAIAGFAALFFAPGQGERYEGLAQKAGMWGRVVQHGIEGNLDILRNVVVYGAPVLMLLALVLIVAINDRDKLREPLRFIGLALAAATLIAMTIFVSPKLGPRFYYVSMALLLAGLVGVIDAVLTPRQLAPFVVLAVIASGYAAYRTVPLYAKLDRQGAARIAALEAHPRGTVFIADAFAQVDEDWWSLGDDFRDAKKRELVATYFDLAGVVFRAYNPNVPLGVMGARLVPHYKVSPESCLDSYGGFALGSFKGFDLAGLHREMKIAVALLQERIGSSATLHELELAVELDDPAAKLPRAKTLVGRWTPRDFEGHIGKIVRRSRGRTRDIVLPKDLDGKDIEVYVYNVGGEVKPLGTGGGGELTYVPWRAGVYWVLACRPDECWVIAATRQGG
jgi:hypothetical protein